MGWIIKACWVFIENIIYVRSNVQVLEKPFICAITAVILVSLAGTQNAPHY